MTPKQFIRRATSSISVLLTRPRQLSSGDGEPYDTRTAGHNRFCHAHAEKAAAVSEETPSFREVISYQVVIIGSAKSPFPMYMSLCEQTHFIHENRNRSQYDWNARTAADRLAFKQKTRQFLLWPANENGISQADGVPN